MGSASLITAWNHSGLTGPRDKDSHELYSALAGLSGCLCRDWQAIPFLRWKNAGGQPTARYLSISLSKKKKVPAQSAGQTQKNVTSELEWRTLHSRLTQRRVRMHNNCSLFFNVYYHYYFAILSLSGTLKRCGVINDERQGLESELRMVALNPQLAISLASINISFLLCIWEQQ